VGSGPFANDGAADFQGDLADLSSAKRWEEVQDRLAAIAISTSYIEGPEAKRPSLPPRLWRQPWTRPTRQRLRMMRWRPDQTF
jgi:hypothetical protein